MMDYICNLGYLKSLWKASDSNLIGSVNVCYLRCILRVLVIFLVCPAKQHFYDEDCQTSSSYSTYKRISNMQWQVQ